MGIHFVLKIQLKTLEILSFVLLHNFLIYAENVKIIRMHVKF